MKTLLIILFCLVSYSTFSQTYYGKKDFGKLEMISDSTCIVSFLEYYPYKFSDTCSFTINNDTMFLSTKIPKPYTITRYEDKIPITFSIEEQISFCIVKQYSNIFNEDDKYSLISEYVTLFDTNNKLLIINDCKIFNKDILVIKYGNYERLQYSGIEGKYFTIKFNGYDYAQYLFFDKFPLLIQNNKLVPIDIIKNQQCWIDNGFYFPVMSKSKKAKKYKTIGHWYKGLVGLPNAQGYDGKPYYATGL